MEILTNFPTKSKILLLRKVNSVSQISFIFVMDLTQKDRDQLISLLKMVWLKNLRKWITGRFDIIFNYIKIKFLYDSQIQVDVPQKHQQIYILNNFFSNELKKTFFVYLFFMCIMCIMQSTFFRYIQKIIFVLFFMHFIYFYISNFGNPQF